MNRTWSWHVIRTIITRLILVVSLTNAAASSSVFADFQDAVSYHRTAIITDFGGVEIEVHIVDLYLVSNSEDDRLLNIFNLSIQCGAPSYYQSFSALPPWCVNVQKSGPFQNCVAPDSFVTIGGIGPHGENPSQCSFNELCSCGDIDFPNPNFPFGWSNGNPAGDCGRPVETPIGLGVFIGRFVSTEAFTLHGSSLEATWNQGLGTPGVQAGFVVTNLNDSDGDCLPDPEFNDCDENGVPDDKDLLLDPSLDCDDDGVIDFCELGLTFDPVFQAHDDVPEDVVGIKGEGGTLAWFEAFDAVTDELKITLVGVDFGIPGGPGPALDGADATLAIWTDSDGDGDPSDSTVLATAKIVITNSIETGLQEHRFKPPVTIPAGTPFLVGVLMNIPADSYPATVDTSGGSTGSWIAFDPDGLDASTVGSAAALGRLADFGFDWRWMITAKSQIESTSEDCDADGRLDECAILDGETEDCDENGVPDSCDIGDGTEDDVNANGVPDSCELAKGDFNLDGCVDSADLGILLGLWGSTDPPVGDLNGDGEISAADLGLLIGNWAPCDP